MSFKKILISGANADVRQLFVGQMTSTTDNSFDVVVRNPTTGQLFTTGTYADAGTPPTFPGEFQGNISLTVPAGASTPRNIFLGSNRTSDASASIDFITGTSNNRGLSITREEGLNGSSSFIHYGTQDFRIDLADGDGSSVNNAIQFRNESDDILFQVKANKQVFFGNLRQVETTFPVFYNPSSDELVFTTGGSTKKIKNNIQDLDPTIVENFDKIRPVNFNYIKVPDKEISGFVAEELNEVHPSLVRYGPNYQVTDKGEFAYKEPLVDDQQVPNDLEDRAILAAIVAKIQELDKKIQELKNLRSNAKI